MKQIITTTVFCIKKKKYYFIISVISKQNYALRRKKKNYFFKLLLVIIIFFKNKILTNNIYTDTYTGITLSCYLYIYIYKYIDSAQCVFVYLMMNDGFYISLSLSLCVNIFYVISPITTHTICYFIRFSSLFLN